MAAFNVRPHRRSLILLAVLAAALAFDLTRAPAAQWSAAAAVAGIHGYQATLAPVNREMGLRCRFEPSCSRYGEASIRKYGMLKGGWRTLRRIARCGPWTRLGTVDPP